MQAAREAAARDFQARVEAAIETVETLQAAKRPSDKKPARASTTDVEARVMKMGDGGFRPYRYCPQNRALIELSAPLWPRTAKISLEKRGGH